METELIKAVILAGGLGKRLGLGPKALVNLRGASLLQRAVSILRQGGLSSIVAVLPTSCSVAHPPCETLYNPDTENGPFDSLWKGFHHWGPMTEALLVMPVDHPLVTPETVATLLAVHGSTDQSTTPYLSPTCAGEPGHPVLLRRKALDVLMETKPTSETTLRDVLNQSGLGREVEVKDRGVLFNVNYPEDLGEAATVLASREAAD